MLGLLPSTSLLYELSERKKMSIKMQAVAFYLIISTSQQCCDMTQIVVFQHKKAKQTKRLATSFKNRDMDHKSNSIAA